jgi:5-methylcytosine-specific restriction endonuclease McrA
MLPPRSNRTDAKAQGLKRYLGRPCKVGHSGERYTRSAECCECRRLSFAVWTATNRETYNEYARAYYHALPPAKLAKQREKFAAGRRLWAATNREALLASKKKYWHENREQWRAYVRNRRARLAGVPGIHTGEDVIVLRAKQKDRCKFCKIDLRGKGEADHITPLSRGGTNWPHNLQLLCMPCNRKKHAKDLIAHARAIGLIPRQPNCP